MNAATIKKLIEAANKLEAEMINQMSEKEYISYMAMPRDDRFKLVCAGLAAAIS